MADDRRGVLEGAFLLLEALATTGDAGLTRIAAAAGLPKSTTHRLLDQLVELGAVRRRNGRYRIGSRMASLGQAWQPAPALRAAAHHPLRELAGSTRPANLVVAVIEAKHTVIVAGVPGEVDEIQPVRAGTVLPPGNAMEVLMAVDRPGADPPACYSRKEWAQLATRASERGVAICDHDFTAPVHCLTAPIRAGSGEVVAGLGAAVLEGGKLDSMIPVVQRAAGMISANLAKAGPARV